MSFSAIMVSTTPYANATEIQKLLRCDLATSLNMAALKWWHFLSPMDGFNYLLSDRAVTSRLMKILPLGKVHLAGNYFAVRSDTYTLLYGHIPNATFPNIYRFLAIQYLILDWSLCLYVATKISINTCQYFHYLNASGFFVLQGI